MFVEVVNKYLMNLSLEQCVTNFDEPPLMGLQKWDFSFKRLVTDRTGDLIF